MATWLVFTDAQVDAVVALNDAERSVQPRLVDNPAHAQCGKHTLPADIITASGYERFRSQLAALPEMEGGPTDLFLASDLLI